jgi:cell wall assembly regulator SMI1
VEEDAGADNAHDGQTNEERCREERTRLEEVDEMQEWADRNSWTLVCESRPVSMETTRERSSISSFGTSFYVSPNIYY